MNSGGVVGILARRIGAGEFVNTAWCGLPDPAVAELLVREGFDSATFDLQHGMLDFAAVVHGIGQVALAGKPALARIPIGDFALAARLVDAGAAGIIAPMINGVEDARAFASAIKFPPLGARSWGPHRAIALTGHDHPTYFREANALHLAIAMIETRAALEALEAILGVAGIDGVFVGPSDLSIALSEGAGVDPHSGPVDEALGHVAARARAHGKFAAAFCFSGADARRLAGRGYALCSISTDSLLLRAAARAELAASR